MENIVVFVDDYVPGSTKVAAKMMHELNIELVGRGHQVDVFTPNSVSCHDIIDGVNIYRFKSGTIKNTSLIKRGINEGLLSLNVLKAYYRLLSNKKYSLIINYSPTIFWSLIVYFLKKRSDCKTFLILRDFFPQWIIDNGLIHQTSCLAHCFKWFEKVNYRVSDVIGIQSPRNIEFFQSKHSNIYNTVLLYNWAKFATSVTTSDEFRCRLNLQNKIIFLYGGNIGKAQDIANLVRLAQRLQYNEKIHFLFVGEGDEVDVITRAIEQQGLKNITYLPPINQQEFKLLLREVDIGLFSLCKSHQSHNFPGKLLGYMVNKLPILGSINPGNDLKEVVDHYQAGLVTVNGDDEVFYQNALALANDANLRRSLGNNAYHMLLDKFTVESAATKILQSVGLE